MKIRLTESQLTDIVKETVKKTLNEMNIDYVKSKVDNGLNSFRRKDSDKAERIYTKYKGYMGERFANDLLSIKTEHISFNNDRGDERITLEVDDERNILEINNLYVLINSVATPTKTYNDEDVDIDRYKDFMSNFVQNISTPSDAFAIIEYIKYRIAMEYNTEKYEEFAEFFIKDRGFVFDDEHDSNSILDWHFWTTK